MRKYDEYTNALLDTLSKCNDENAIDTLLDLLEISGDIDGRMTLLIGLMGSVLFVDTAENNEARYPVIKKIFATGRWRG